jgi:AraC family transcriptional regulator
MTMTAKYGANSGLAVSEEPIAKRFMSSCTILGASDGLGWPNLLTRLVEGLPHDQEHNGRPNLWISMPLVDGDIGRIVGQREERAMMPAQRICMLPPQTPFVSLLGTRCRFLHVFLRPGLVNEVAGELFDHAKEPEILPVFGKDDPCMSSLLRAIMETMSEPAGSSALKIEYLSRALATDLLAKHSALSRGPLAADICGRLNARQIQRVLEYIQENLASEISLNELAAVAGVSRTAFIRRFKTSLSRTPHQYLMRARVQRGQELLSTSNLTAAQIAYLCGFADHAHFTTVFKRMLGITPSAYRRDRD